MASPFEPVSFTHGPAMANRFMLAPLTNLQSHPDGTLSADEEHWLVKRAEGGFGLTMTCASHVQAIGQGFPGQLGCFGEEHLEGLTRLATKINATGSVSVVQLHHAGMRSPAELIGTQPVAPFDDPDTGARALTTAEVEAVIEDFVASAERCQRAGFAGVELHGAHGYLLCQFLDGEHNHRTDGYGGSLENRAKVLLSCVSQIRQRCGEDFHLGVRLSTERFGISTPEMLTLYRWLVDTGEVDLIDLSLWDAFKVAFDEEFAGRRVLELFTELDRGAVRLAAAGRIYNGADVRLALDLGADIVALGRAAITNHDFPRQLEANPDFAMRTLPVPASVLAKEGLSQTFIDYMSGWNGFVEA